MKIRVLNSGPAGAGLLRRCRGFTLLEIMLATVILALVVSMITLSLSGSLRVVEATRDQGDLYYRAQVAMERICQDLASAMLTDDGEFVGHPVEDGETKQAVLHFVSMAHQVFDPKKGHPGMAEISYLLTRDPENNGQLLLLRSDQVAVPREKKSEGPGVGENAFLLTDHLRSVVFTYFDAQGEEHDSWDTRVDPDAGTDEKKRKHRLPAAVGCTLEFQLDTDQETGLQFQTKVLLPTGMISASDR
ncbi:MAG TPA: prepilin-type N-terminal cleavage/methylation domain-containing protein [Desulfobulbaceae bacterium]|nr:prepilin-type N-terminal cleavage/methylation domain-containing protein [Desulfobulbaceae bacterium]